MGSQEIIFSVITKYLALLNNFSVKVGESLGSIVGHDQFSVRVYEYVPLRLKLKFVKIKCKIITVRIIRLVQAIVSECDNSMNKKTVRKTNQATA